MPTITYQTVREGEQHVYLDEELMGKIHCSIFGRRPPFPSQCDSIEEFRKLFAAKEYECGWKYVIRTLSKRAYNTQSLRRLLQRKCVSIETINKLIEKCVSRGYCQDQEWMKHFIQSQKKKLGSRAIVQKLRMKGFASEEAEAAVGAFAEDPHEQIVNLLSTRYRNRNLQDYDERRKVISSLLRRGFPLDAIYRACEVKSLEVD